MIDDTALRGNAPARHNFNIEDFIEVFIRVSGRL